MARRAVRVPAAVIARITAAVPEGDQLLYTTSGVLKIFLAGGGTLVLFPPRVRTPRDLDEALGEYTAPSNDTDTSIAAAASLSDAGPKLCREVFHVLQQYEHGLTCFELEAAFGRQHQTISARLWDLHTRGLIHDSGLRRKSPSRRWAIVWKVGRVRA